MRLHQLLLLAAFSLSTTSCLLEPLVFRAPLDGAVVDADPKFVIEVPGSGAPVVFLDGEPLLEGWELKDGRVYGNLAGLAPGPHQLRADYSYGGPFASSAFTNFVVAGDASYDVQGSIGQLAVTHADPGDMLELRNARGGLEAEGEADSLGSYIFREIKPGAGYYVSISGPPAEVSGPVTVLDPENSVPDQAFYDDQVLEPGFGYITTRDGTKLSIYVQLPGPPEAGPYPTLVNYSGYEPSQPAGALSIGGVDLSGFCGAFPVLCDAPNHPSGIIGGVLGFATVGVNMRGTGCSGGAYDFFEPAQLTDGYDIIEAVAAQPWVKHGKVGMAGLSFPGISQLFVASTQPPSLAAITPLSVISSVETILGPGGMINDGFALEWGQRVLDRADPYGQGWEQGMVDAGDTVCEENQLLHAQKVDIIQKAFDNQFYVPEIYDPLSPNTFVDRIQVPVFTTGQWQDEQTGGHFPDLWNRFAQAPVFRFTGTNGAHADGYTPQILIEWKHFLDFYVSREVRPIHVLIRAAAPLLFEEIFGVATVIPPHRFLGYPTFEDALDAYEAEPEGRILFESGADPVAGPGAPVASFELALPEWPPPTTVAERYYLNADGSLRTTPPVEAESGSAFQHANEKGGETYDVNGAFEDALPDIEWLPWQPGRQAVWLTAPLADDVVMLGHASADLYLQATGEDADVEVMISEVRPDGQEMYVTSGWLRASRRRLDDARSTPLKPKQTHREVDVEVLPEGQWELARVEIYPFAHVFRAGSQLRVSVATPGANKGRWKFDVLQYEDPVAVGVSHSATFPSSLLLPVLPGVVAPPGVPPCPGTRGQYCRTYEPHFNAAW